MTNKPIMIDGVDVSKCEFFKIENVKNLCDEIEIQYICGITNEYSKDAFTINAPNLHCERNPNCYYKQLSRKTQECEYWKHQAELGSDTTDRLVKQLEEKEQECEELKRDNSNLFNKVMETRKENEELKNEIEACYNQVEDFDIIATSKSNKLKQAEQKINKIKDKCNETLELMDKDSGTNAYAGGRCTEAVQILQIIGEVE